MDHFWRVQNFEFKYLFFRKNEYFRGMKIVWIFWGYSQNWTILGIISMHFRVFFTVNVQNRNNCFGLLNFKYLFGYVSPAKFKGTFL